MKNSQFAVLIASVLALFVSSAVAQERIVSIGGDVTEILFAIGEGEKVVATDDDSVHPKAALDAPKVGYVRRLSAEGVLSAEPDLILISGAAGPPAVMDQLRASGVRLVEMEEEYTVDAILRKVATVSGVLEREKAGAALMNEIEADWAEARSEIARYKSEPTVLFFAALSDGAPRAAGTETAAHGVIEMLGARNAFDSQTGYKNLSLEAAVAANPDVIFVMNHHAARLGGIEAVRAHPALRLTDAAKNNRILIVDKVTVMQFGPRTPRAVLELARDVSAALAD